ncbi:kinase-like domain-containing protein [Aspergillus unguis]
MRINSTAECLTLVSETLKTSIEPEIASPNGKALLGIIQQVLLDLLKRQGPSITLLKQIIYDGQTLGDEMLRLLGSPTVGAWPGTAAQTFDELAVYYDYLCCRLDRLSKTLSSTKRGHSEVPGLLRRAAEWECAYYSGIQKIDARLPPGPEESSSFAPPLTKEFLHGFLTKRRGALEITRFELMTGGHGKQSYVCELRYENGTTDRLVIRKCDRSPVLMRGMFQVDQEYHILDCLSKTSFPSPKPYELGAKQPGANGVDAPFFTMEFIEGDQPSSFLEQHGGDLSEGLFLQLAELLAKLHTLPLETFDGYIRQYESQDLYTKTTEQRYKEAIEAWYEYAQTVEHQPSTYLVWLFNWLRDNVPHDSRPPVLTHGDFNVHNVLVKDDSVVAMLDWECADFAAPEQDLAYIHPVVSKKMSWDKFLDHYRASGVKEINPSYFGFCQAYSVLRTTLALNRATMNLQNRWAPDIRFTTMELGYNAMFMGMGLQYTASDGGAPHDACSKTKAKTNGVPNHVSGGRPVQEDTLATVSQGHRLISYGDHANVRQTPGPGETWQESVVLVWWDSNSAVGGFHRLGHEPNRTDGAKVTLWSHLVSPAGHYKRQRHQPLRKEDQLANGGFGSGDDTLRFYFEDGEHILEISDGDISARLSFTDIGPNIDGFPKSSTITEGLASHHFDIPGHVRGWVKVKGHEYPVTVGLGIRDHAWGPRDWSQTIQGHRWVVGAAGDALGFVGVAFQAPNDSVAKFGWVVRDGVVTLAKDIDIVAHMEADSQVNRGGEVTYTLTTGEKLHFVHKPATPAACVSPYLGLNCVDRICRFECSNGLRGFSCFETTCNIKRLSARPTKFLGGIADDGFHPF